MRTLKSIMQRKFRMRHVRMVALVAAAAMHGALPLGASAQDQEKEASSSKKA